MRSPRLCGEQVFPKDNDMTFRFSQLEIPDVILVEASNLKDDRGFFRETYKQSEFAANGIPLAFVQDNHSRSARGVIRGLHYQKQPKAQGKLVIVTRGEIFDVAVDIRKGSPTYGHWVGRILSVDNGKMLYVPPGFAHGFCALSERADVTYKVTNEYAPELDRGIVWNDPAIGIEWRVREPLLSPKDAALPLLKDADNDLEL
jgi:dTDP-4-dehydrorhamnose 3,5-epimerase